MPKSVKKTRQQRRYDPLNQSCELKGILDELGELELEKAHEFVTWFHLYGEKMCKYLLNNLPERLETIKEVYPVLYARASLTFRELNEQIDGITIDADPEYIPFTEEVDDPKFMIQKLGNDKGGWTQYLSMIKLKEENKNGYYDFHRIFYEASPDQLRLISEILEEKDRIPELQKLVFRNSSKGELLETENFSRLIKNSSLEQKEVWKKIVATLYSQI